MKSLATEPRRLGTTGDDLQMRYLVSVIDDKSEPGSTDREPAISAFNERLIAEGHWVFAGGLADTDAATVVDNRGEQAVFSDGPFVESKEYLAGVWVWEAPDLDVALKLAAEASKVCDRKIEVRPFR
ncbi:YciI family protein [Actinomadura mexicana]|nr:YciI family protein [Actinomadura mexicana]